MKLLLAATFAFFIVTNLPVGAEIKPETRSFDSFWIKFKAAVAKGDKAAIAEMTKFPFDNGAKYQSKEEFIEQCGALFDKKTQKCFSKAKPVKEDNRDRYNVFCGEDIFGFAKVDGEYRFTYIGIND